MNRFLVVAAAGTLLLALGSPVAARSRHAAEPPASPPPTLLVPDSSTLPSSEPAPLGEVAPLPPPAYVMPAPLPFFPVTRTRKYWELSAVGGAVLGGIYVLSIFTGSMSYAGFYQGQWGWFVPLVGPMLTMGGGGGQLCACFSNQFYTYGIGTVLTLATLGALVPVVLGGVLNKSVTGGRSRIQLAPNVASDATGLVLLGRF